MTTLCLYVGGAFESKKDLGMGLNGLAERFVTGQRGLATHTRTYTYSGTHKFRTGLIVLGFSGIQHFKLCVILLEVVVLTKPILLQ